MDPSIPENLDDYSAASTTIKFDSPIPLLRGPTPAAPPDDPSSGPYVLAFKNPESWAAAYKASESKIIQQCEGGARIGCAIAASDKCKPPWWRNLIGGKQLADLKEREVCEEREMEGCMAVGKEKCVGFAKDKCRRPFGDARIAAVRQPDFKKLLCLVSGPERNSGSMRIALLMGLDGYGFGFTNSGLASCWPVIPSTNGFSTKANGVIKGFGIGLLSPERFDKRDREPRFL